MVTFKFIDGQRFIVGDRNEIKKQNFNTEIQDALNKLLGMRTAEEKLLKNSSLNDDIKKQQIKKIRTFQRKLYKLYVFQI